MEGEGLHQIPVGPVHAGMIEPGHFRFTANGEHVVRLEQRFGYVHKGIEVRDGGRLPARRRGEAGFPHVQQQRVAYAFAFAQAAEAALDVKAPPRALLPARADERTRRSPISFGDISTICNDASFRGGACATASCASACCTRPSACFGRRLMMNTMRAGGVALDIAADGMAGAGVAAGSGRRFPHLVEFFSSTSSLQDSAP